MNIITNKMDISLFDWRMKYNIYTFQLKDKLSGKFISRQEFNKLELKTIIKSIYMHKTNCGDMCISVLVNKEFSDFPALISTEYELVSPGNLYFQPIKQLLLSTLFHYDKSMSNVSGKLWQLTTLKSVTNCKTVFEYNLYNDILSQKVISLYHISNFNDYQINKYLIQEQLYEINGMTIAITKKRDKNREIYLKMKPDTINKKNTQVFFKISDNENDYRKTKVYYYSQMLKLIKERLENEMIVEFNQYAYQNFVSEYKQSNEIKNICNQINDTKFNIVNKLIDAESELNNVELKNEMSKILSKTVFKKNIEVDLLFSKRIRKNMCNFVFVNSPKQYKQNQCKDRHTINSKIAVQNINIDKFKKTIKDYDTKNSIPEASVYLLENLIKRDIVDRKLRLTNIGMRDYEDWVFIYGRYNKKKKIGRYFTLQIINKELIFNEYFPIESEIHKLKSFSCEGLLKINKTIYTITKTDEIPFPDIKFIDKQYQKISKNHEVEKALFLKHLRDFLHIENRINNCDGIILNIEKNMDIIINKNEIKTLLTQYLSKLKLKGKFISYFEKKTGILIEFRLSRKEDKTKIYNFAGNLKYYDDEKEFKYFVPYRAISKVRYNTLDKAFTVRIIKNFPHEYIEKYLRLLKTEFVRIDKDSVIPFPFKYLREYINMELKKGESSI